MSTCRACQAPIIWARTGSNKSIPIDPEPTDNGNVELVNGTAKVWGTSHQWPPETPRYTPHHATCPNWKATKQR